MFAVEENENLCVNTVFTDKHAKFDKGASAVGQYDYSINQIVSSVVVLLRGKSPLHLAEVTDGIIEVGKILPQFRVFSKNHIDLLLPALINDVATQSGTETVIVETWAKHKDAEGLTL